MCEAEMFPNISKLLTILCALPVSTAEPERFFSKLEKTLTSLRSSMGEERLESLIMLQVHRTRTPSVQEVINLFSGASARKLNFLYLICYRVWIFYENISIKHINGNFMSSILIFFSLAA